MKIDSMKILEAISKIKYDISQLQKHLLDSYPIEMYISLLCRRPETASYTFISLELNNFCSKMLKSNGKRALQLYHKLVMLTLIDQNSAKLHTMKLPDSIKIFFQRVFEMIGDEISLNPDDYYEYPNDKFVKDLNICSMKLIPIGPGVIELSRIPISILLNKGSKQFIIGTQFLLFKVGGLRPLYQIHTYLRGLADFNELEWYLAFQRIADVLKIESRVKGVFRSSWFIDPKLKTISPKLTYLREIFEQNGGNIFYIGATKEDIENATFKSPTRRKLYEEGKYIPTKYMAIWPRNYLIKWAENYYESKSRES